MAISKTPNPNQGKCSQCGFLSKRFPPQNPRDTDLHREYTDQDRLQAAGNKPRTQPLDRWVPACFVGSECFSWHLSVAPYDFGSEVALFAFKDFQEDKQCRWWAQWIPGISPKECLDKMLLQQIEQDRIEHREQMTALIAAAQKDQTAIVQAHKEVAEAHKEVAEGQRQAAIDTKKVTERLETIALEMKDASLRMEASTSRTTWIVIGLAVLQVVLAAVAIVVPLWIESPAEKLLRQIVESLRH